MRKTFVIAGLLLLTFALTAAAKERHWIKLYNDSAINGATLQPGLYRMELNGQEAIFYKGSKEVARSAVTREDFGSKFDRDSVLYQGTTVTEIRITGKNSKLVLSPGAVASKAAEKSSRSNN